MAVKKGSPRWSQNGETDRANEIVNGRENQRDRGCVIFGTQIIDEELEQFLRDSFVPNGEDEEKIINNLFSTYSPLSTFAAKIDMAFAFGIIPKELRDTLHVLRKMRNDFAHSSADIDFDDEAFKSRYAILVKATEPANYEAGASPSEDTEDEDELIEFGGAKISKKKYANRLAFFLVIAGLSGLVAGCGEHRIKELNRQPNE